MKHKTTKPEVLMISKPIVPPWDDSAKNIVASQVTRGERYSYRILTDKSAPSLAPSVISDPIYPGRGTYSAGIVQNLRVMLYGLRSRGAAIYHYFFAPNPITSMAGRLQKHIARVKTVQTVCSAPASYDGIGRFLFADLTIVLSDNTRRLMIEAGVDSSKLRLVKPCVEPIDRPSQAQRLETRRAYDLPENGPVILFPGDYEFSSAAHTVAQAVPQLAEKFGDIKIVFACRIKREPSRVIRDKLKSDLQTAGHGDRVEFIDHVSNMPALAGAADVVVMPADSLYAKMDVPLVLLEAMSQHVPLVIAESAPLNELLSFEAGLGVPPGEPEALAGAVTRILQNSSLGKELGKSGAQAVRRSFSADTMARAIETIYDEVLEK
ncbi:MAG: glycosyltransferase family 4 protein [Deltaproteobacteria bacterium]|nr:glycosyltransferase family 4 protein [Deltaproteobacteria bacterium]